MPDSHCHQISLLTHLLRKMRLFWDNIYDFVVNFHHHGNGMSFVSLLLWRFMPVQLVLSTCRVCLRIACIPTWHVYWCLERWPAALSSPIRKPLLNITLSYNFWMNSSFILTTGSFYVSYNLYVRTLFLNVAKPHEIQFCLFRPMFSQNYIKFVLFTHTNFNF